MGHSADEMLNYEASAMRLDADADASLAEDTARAAKEATCNLAAVPDTAVSKAAALSTAQAASAATEAIAGTEAATTAVATTAVAPLGAAAMYPNAASEAVVATARPRRGRKALQPKNSGIIGGPADAPPEQEGPLPSASANLAGPSASLAAANVGSTAAALSASRARVAVYLDGAVGGTLSDGMAVPSASLAVESTPADSNTEEDVDNTEEGPHSKRTKRGVSKKRSRPGADDAQDASTPDSSLPWTDSDSETGALEIEVTA